MLVFEEKRKPEYSEINLSEQKRERTTSSTHIWCRRLDLTTLVRGKCSRYCAILVPPPLSEIEVNLYCEHEYRDWPINVGCALAPVKSSSYNFQYFSQYQHLPSTNICIHQPAPSIVVNCEQESLQSASWRRDLCSQSNIKATVVYFFTFKHEETVVSKTKDKQ